MLTKEQLERLAELKSSKTLTLTEKAELDFLQSFVEPEKEDTESSDKVWGLSEICKVFKDNHRTFVKLLADGNTEAVQKHLETLVSKVAKNTANHNDPLVNFEPMKQGKYNIGEVSKIIVKQAEESPEELKKLNEIVKTGDQAKFSLKAYRIYCHYQRSTASIYADLLETYHVMPTVYAANLLDVLLLAYLPSTLENFRKAYPESVRNELEDKPYTKEEYRLSFGVLDVIKDGIQDYTVGYLKSLAVQKEFDSLDANHKLSEDFAKRNFMNTIGENIPDALKALLSKLLDKLD